MNGRTRRPACVTQVDVTFNRAHAAVVRLLGMCADGKEAAHAYIQHSWHVKRAPLTLMSERGVIASL